MSHYFDLRSINAQTTSFRIASTCSVGLSPANFGEIEGQLVAACDYPDKEKIDQECL